MKHLWIITLFPEFFGPLVSCGVIGQLLSGKRGEGFTLHLVNPRDFALDKYKSVDDYPAGGGGGLIMRPDILSRALLEGVVKAGGYPENFKTTFMLSFLRREEKSGRTLFAGSSQKNCIKIFPKDLVFICGRYEGVDERFIEKYVDEQISVGDYILSGAEVAVMAILDSALRFCPGVVGNETGPEKESFSDGLLEHPQYTLPREFEGVKIPEILYSGHHANIEKWRLEKALDLTRTNSRIFLRGTVKDTKIEVFVGLVHWPVLNKRGQEVTTSVTNLDIHDIARSSRTFGCKNFFIVTPIKAQHELLKRILAYWEGDEGNEYNPDRHDALSFVRLVDSIEEASAEVERKAGQKPLIAVTSAKPSLIDGDAHELMRQALVDRRPILLLFGTGWGLTASVMERADFRVGPISGAAEDGYNHLSVRSAVAIYLDRLRGGL